MSNRVSFEATAKVERFDESVEWFRERHPVTPDVWATMDEYAKKRAFTISGVTQMSAMTAAHDVLSQAIEEGWKLETTVAKLESALSAYSFSGHRLATIARTNSALAYSAGRYQQLSDPVLMAIRPYRQFDGIDDFRQTDICNARDGIALPADDPWWNANWPPLHHRCRSQIRSLADFEYEEDVDEDKKSVPIGLDDPSDGFGSTPSIEPEWSPDLASNPPAIANEFTQKRAKYLKKEVDEELKKAEEEAETEVAEVEAATDPFSKAEFDALDSSQIEDLEEDRSLPNVGRGAKEQSKKLSEDVSPEELEAIEGFTFGYDWTIRKMESGDLSDQELFDLRREHIVRETAAGKPTSETEDETRQHVKDARRYRVGIADLFKRHRDGVANGKYSTPVTTVYRGLGGMDAVSLRKILSAGEFDMRRQTSSTSWYPGIAYGFATDNATDGAWNVVLQMRTTSGVPIETMSEFETEHELLLHGDTKFRIVKVTRLQGYADGKGEGTLLIEAEEI